MKKYLHYSDQIKPTYDFASTEIFYKQNNNLAEYLKYGSLQWRNNNLQVSQKKSRLLGKYFFFISGRSGVIMSVWRQGYLYCHLTLLTAGISPQIRSKRPPSSSLPYNYPWIICQLNLHSPSYWHHHQAGVKHK